MRKAALYGLAVVCVCMLFALSGPSAQKIVSGDGGGSTSGPVPVTVANFPQTQVVQVQKPVTVTGSVAVTNFPALQQVAGTVNVGNIPAVQSVSGSVSVSNLPLDQTGSLRVAGVVQAPATSSFVRIADGVSVVPGTGALLGPFPVAGWRTFTLFLRAILPTTGEVRCFSSQVQEGAPDLAVYLVPQIFNASGRTCTDTLTDASTETVESVQHGELIAPELQLFVSADYRFPTNLTYDAWLYLSN